MAGAIGPQGPEWIWFAFTMRGGKTEQQLTQPTQLHLPGLEVWTTRQQLYVLDSF